MRGSRCPRKRLGTARIKGKRPGPFLKGGGLGGFPFFLMGSFFAKLAFVEMAFVGPLKQKNN